jgi:RNA polymerase sigma factor (sigma-70 family)
MTAALSNWSGIGPGSSDAELAVAAAAGDRNAFAGIYDRYADRLHDFCIGMLRDRDSAADCVQDAFCIISTGLGGLREPDKLRPWLYSIVRNEAHKRLRELKRERPTDEMPDVVSHDAGPDTMAQRMALANLISEAAGGLSDRDQAVLELAYRQGLDGPELAMALGVTQTNANTMVGRLRETIERSLGALLVARRIQADPASCPELASLLHGWDGKFNILMRKRIARHIESCEACDELRRRSVSPAALLGAPVFIPAPAWMKNSVMRDFELTSASHRMQKSTNNAATQMAPRIDQSHLHGQDTAAPPAVQPPPQAYAPPPAAPAEEDKRRVVPFMALLVGLPLLILGATLAWVYLPSTALSPSGVVQPAPKPTPSPTIPAPAPAALLPSAPPPKATPGPIPVQTPRPAAPLPTPQGRVPTPQAPIPTPQAPIPTPQAPIAPLSPPLQAPAPIVQPPLGSLPLPRLPLPQMPPPQLPYQAPAQLPPAQAPQAPAQAPKELPPQQVPAQPPADEPKQPTAGEPDPVGPAPKQVPDPVGPAPKKVDTPPAQHQCDPATEICVK